MKSEGKEGKLDFLALVVKSDLREKLPSHFSKCEGNLWGGGRGRCELGEL